MRGIVSPADLKRGELVEPGWYPAQIVEYKEEAAKTDESCNSIFYFKLLAGKSEGNVVKRLFNEKALGFGKNMYAALSFPFDPEQGYILTTELFKAQEGKKLMIYIKRGKSNLGNEFNDVADFRPFEG
jgi:hypothetical protein